MTPEEFFLFMQEEGFDQASIDRLMRVQNIVDVARTILPDAWAEPLTHEQAPARRRSLLVAAAEVGG